MIPKRQDPQKILDLRRQKVKSRRLGLPILLAIVVLLAVVAAGCVVWKLTRPQNLNNVYVIERLVGRHYLLPSGVPTLATVTDKSKLQTPFLQQADNGDKILIYERAGVAIIYRPSIDRIIATGPVEIQPLDTAKGGS